MFLVNVKNSPHKLFLVNVKVPEGERVWASPCMPHSTKGTASLMLYPLVHVTVICLSHQWNEIMIGMINLYNIMVHQIFEWWEPRISILHSKIFLGIIGDRLEPLDMHIPPYLILLSALAETTKKSKRTEKWISIFFCVLKKIDQVYL